MLTTHRRDRRNRRQALFTLESLDERLVLSAGAGAAAAGAVSPHEAHIARHEARLARMHARHEARLARIAARHEARLATWAALHPIVSVPVGVPVDGGASASASAATAAAAPVSSAGGGPVLSTPTSSGDVGVSPVAPIPVPTPTPTPTPSPQPSPNPLPDNVAAALQSLYSEFQGAGSGDFTPSQASDKMLVIDGDNVEVSLKIGPGTDFATALSQLQADGMQVFSSSADYALINGMLPISELPAAAQIASSVSPVPAPLKQ